MTSTSTAVRTGGRAAFTGLEIAGISKAFGSVRALEDVGFHIKPGTVHALIGENGAGKSTLGKIIAGVVQPDQGHVAFNCRVLSLRSPRDALVAGIATIEQEISLAPNLTVQDNVFLGAEPRTAGFVSGRELNRRWDAVRTESGFNLAALDRVGSLRLGERQQVEILRAVSRQADLIVMDEPTAALSGQEVRALHKTIRSVVARGASVLIVTHFLKEVLALADTITVLREGRHVRTGPASNESETSLINAMLGRDLSAVFPEKRQGAGRRPVVLSGENIAAPGVDGVSMEVRAGEIVGLAGLENSGRSELARALYGDLALRGGTVTVGGHRLRRPNPRRALARGLTMVPASRRDDGLFLNRPIIENSSISSLPSLSRAGVVRRRAEAKQVTEVLFSLGVPADRGRSAVSTLSGGNQQKVLFARALLRNTVALIAHEPTRGVDIGAKAAIYELLGTLAADGLGVLLISSEPQELIGLSHRVLVMHRGRLSDELTGADICEERILTAALTNVREDLKDPK
jgi:simple sugar transport system ATP-binding protein/ribose transport system ATP-binding protein